jgi:hypothetical protein
MGKNLKSLAKKILEEEQGFNSAGNGRPLDEEYDPLNPSMRGPRSLFRGPNGMVIDQETRAIDELLSGIPKAQGFYLKLLKEIRPGEFEYKIRIDNWEGWTDMQEEIARIVRGYTEKNKFNGRWGSGTYQILISKAGGVRDLAGKYKPVYFAIDAMEPDQQYPAPNPSGGMAGGSNTTDQIEMLGKLLDIVQKGNPSHGNQSLTETIANLKVDLAKNDSTNNTNMMQTAVQTLSQMLTAQMNKPPEQKESLVKELAALITVLAPTGLLNKMFDKPNETNALVTALKQAKELGMIPEQKKEDAFDLLAKLKSAGFLPDMHQKKDTDPVERTLELMGKLKPLISDIKPSSDPLWFKLIDSFAPHALKLGSEALNFMRENSKRRFAQPNVNPAIAGIKPNPALAPQPMITPPADIIPPSSGSSGPSMGIFDDNDDALMQRQNDFIARRNAQLNPNSSNVPINNNAPINNNESQIPHEHFADIGNTIRESNFDANTNFDANANDNANFNTNATANKDLQSNQRFNQQHPSQSAQESIIMQIFAQMKSARDANDPGYFPILRELILQQAGDEMYDSIIAKNIPMMTIFSKVRFIAGSWIDEPKTAAYFNNFLTWAKQQQENEIVAFCSKCDEEIIYTSIKDWNTSDKKCQVCRTSLSLIGQDNGEHLDTDNLVNSMGTGEADIKLPGE